VQSLSGGNQQRVLIGRWLAIDPRVLILHGPTVGVDVGSKDIIYRIMQRLSQRGIGIVLISDDSARTAAELRPYPDDEEGARRERIPGRPDERSRPVPRAAVGSRIEYAERTLQA
jgi:ABC-type microcin C transport system duplicated ATPase subunit YejF